MDPGNARMRWLVDDVIESGAYELLWVPPSMPYYRPEGAFAKHQAFTKRLIFSSWRVVPRAISALLSYEVERRTVGREGTGARYDERSAIRGPLRFSESAGRLTGMPTLALLFPSVFLALQCDPARLASEIVEEKGYASPREVTLDEVLAHAKGLIEVAIERHLPPPTTDGAEDERWYWAAPLLLDSKLQPAATRDWFNQAALSDEWSGGDTAPARGDGEGSDEQSAWAKHVEAARRVALGGPEAAAGTRGESPLGAMPSDLAEVLALLAIGGPAVTAFRSFLHVFGTASDGGEEARTAIRNAAGRAAWAFRGLFNQPEVMAIVRAAALRERRPVDAAHAQAGGAPAEEREAGTYWRAVVEYGARGCLQAVLDEYVHVLRDQAGLFSGDAVQRATRLADEFVEAVRLRTSRVGIDDLARTEGGRTLVRPKEARNLRTHFALRFGDEKSDDGESVTRADQVRSAFNSPFWPFVVASTSVGQEGLDFHLYCHAVVHWNLPSNPVDFEQREGRVHRYKGHAVRKNVAASHGDEALRRGARDRWETAFELARAARAAEASDIVPYWIFTDGPARIERHVPSLPLSRDRHRADRLRGSLAVYRMVFGQARQEDLVSYLIDRVPKEELEPLMREMRIELAP